MDDDIPPISSVDPEPGPWQQIVDEICDLSQEFYAAGWLIQVEYIVWEWIEHPENAPERARERLPRLRQLAEEGGHWVRWDNDRPGLLPVVPIHLDRWRRRHADWVSKGGPWTTSFFLRD